jgi:hypothetical protein
VFFAGDRRLLKRQTGRGSAGKLPIEPLPDPTRSPLRSFGN